MPKGTRRCSGEFKYLRFINVRCLTTVQRPREDGAGDEVLFNADRVWQPSRTVDLGDSLLDPLRESGSPMRHASAEVRTEVPEVRNNFDSGSNAGPDVMFKVVPCGPRRRK